MNPNADRAGPIRVADVDGETRALLALRLVPGLGPRLTRALIGHFGSAEAILQAPPERFAEVPRFPRKLADSFAATLTRVALDQELADIEAAGVRLIGWHAPEYPVALRDLADAPPLLFVRGELTPDEPCIAVVGSRLCSRYGQRVTEQLVRDLVHAGYTIVSGLARGIDRIAHQTALDHGGRTVAVFAGGLLRVYPPEHRELADRIAHQGALVSEHPMRVPPERCLFPQRNRLVSGLCQAVVIVEAGERSGALITARHAAEQGREVFVVPGPIDSPTASGIVYLLRQGACPVRDARDILEILRGKSADRDKPAQLSSKKGPSKAATHTKSREAALANRFELGQSSAGPQSSRMSPTPTAPLLANAPDYVRKLYEALSSEPQDADVLAEQTGLSAQELGRAVVQLELHGLICRLPGNRLARRL